MKRSRPIKRLGPASRASRDITRLGASGTLFSFLLLSQHDGVAGISAHGVLVSEFTGVATRGIRAVSIPGLERIEVQGRTRRVGVPSGVDILLGCE